MSYRYYYYRPRYRRNPAFSYMGCIFNDLKKLFFNLDSETLFSVLEDYGKVYGKSAFDYALKNYTNWKHHVVEMSNQTCLRLVDLVPPYLPTETRIQLFKKLIRHTNISYDFSPVQISESTNWYNAKNAIQSIRKKMDKACNPQSIENNIKKLGIPENLVHYAHWLMDDDISIAKSIIDHYVMEEVKVKVASCYKDLDLYESTINNVTDVYQSSQFRTRCQLFEVSMYIKAEERTFWQKVGLFFKG